VAVSYIDSGDSPTAAVMNALFDEADRKLSIILSGKSLVVHGLKQFVGKYFFFTQGKCAYASNTVDFPDCAPTDGLWTVPGYSDSVFESAKAAAVVASWDDVNQVANLNSTSDSTIWNKSLRAEYLDHNGLRYYVKPFNAEFPERVYKYAQAEILIDGYSNADVPTVTITREHTKYNFFRFHNLTRFNKTVVFEGDYTFTLSPFEQRCVRRTGVGGTYTLGGHYFHKFLEGDPRFYQQLDWETPSLTSHPALSASRCNNVASPVYLLELFNGIANNVVLDYSKFCDITNKAKAYFGDPSDDSLPIGDLLHHRGPFKLWTGSAMVDGRFDGYRNLDATMAALGLTVSTAGDGRKQLAASAGKDILLTGTNFLQTGAAVPGIVNLDAGFTFEAMPSITPTFAPVLKRNGVYSALWSDVQGASSFVHQTTIGDVKRLVPFIPPQSYVEATSGTNSITGVSIAISPEGNWITGTHSFTPHIELSTVFPTQNAYDISGTTLTTNFGFGFDLQPWPTSFGGRGSLGGDFAFDSKYTNGLFPWSSRYAQTLDGSLAAGAKSKDFTGESQSPGGADFGLLPLAGSSEPIGRLELAAESHGRANGARFRCLRYPDALGDAVRAQAVYGASRGNLLAGLSADGSTIFRGLRLPLCSEQYNLMATLVNRVTRCKISVPLLRAIVPQISGTYTLGVLPGPGVNGLAPLGQYSELNVQTMDPTALAAATFGIRVRTIADTPASYQQFLTFANPYYPDYSTKALLIDEVNGELSGDYGFTPGSPKRQWNWLHVDDVKAAYERLGFIFVYAQFSRAITLSYAASTNKYTGATIDRYPQLLAANSLAEADFEGQLDYSGCMSKIQNIPSTGLDGKRSLANGLVTVVMSTGLAAFHKILKLPASYYSKFDAFTQALETWMPIPVDVTGDRTFCSVSSSDESRSYQLFVSRFGQVSLD